MPGTHGDERVHKMFESSELRHAMCAWRCIYQSCRVSVGVTKRLWNVRPHVCVDSNVGTFLGSCAEDDGRSLSAKRLGWMARSAILYYVSPWSTV